jgi:hypothetical protein
MKTTFLLNTLIITIASTILFACNDDSDQPSPAASAACRITKEYIVGTREYVSYEYEGELPKKIVNYNEVEMPEITLDVLALEVRKSSNPSGFPTVLSTHYQSDYLRVSPSSASVSFTYNNVTTTNANTFLYRYDYKGRMIEVIQHTPNTTSDYEYRLTISYDDNDNVIRLRYDLVTGSTDEITIIDVTGYDDHPTPYAGVIGWKFLMSNFTWNNNDPLPVILALTKNNPGEYQVFHKGNAIFSASFSYQYNDERFPTQRDHINKNQDGEHRFSSAFEYECR